MKRSISLGLFIVMCIAVWWSITDDFIEGDKIQITKGKRYVELFMNGFVLTAMDETGRPSYRMNGTRMERYNNSDITEIQQPVLHLLEQENQWLISADIAQLNSKNDTIQLEKNVIMLQQNVEPAMTIRTQKMLIYNQTQIAKSKSPVNITQGISHIKSTGMIYNHKTNKLELTSRVRGEYLPYE